MSSRAKASPLRRDSDGTLHWHANDFSEYHVTGVDTEGRRFKQAHKHWPTANGINLWNGTVWGVTPEGRRHRIKRVMN